jgi:hypothetical protein
MCHALLLIIACVYRYLAVFWLPLLYLDTCRSVHWSQRYVANALSFLLINHQYKRYLVAYSCSLTSLQPMRREQHGSGGNFQMNLLPASSALACHPIGWEQHGSGGNCQTNLLPAISAIYSQPIRCEQLGPGCNFQITLLPIPCSLICHYPIKR